MVVSNTSSSNTSSVFTRVSSLTDNSKNSAFVERHIGIDLQQQAEMLEVVKANSMDELIEQVVPESILSHDLMSIDTGLSEEQALAKLKAIGAKNKPLKSLIGQGYYNCHTPKVILRNLLENPAWYTAYTPYQPEISQGRLEALLNYQTMIADLTGMALANASLLDEATAAAEAMTLCKRMAKSKGNVFFVDQDAFPQTIEVIQTRAKPLGIEIVVGDPLSDLAGNDYFGVLLQYPACSGEVRDYSAVVETAHSKKALVVMAADLLSLMLLKSPGSIGADVAIGSAQRFGVSLGFGGPHAGYMATQETFKRSLPGRVVGVSIDSNGNTAYRLALQTREQHIRREKATSNICTAQVLLAVIASMYAVYHGPQGLRAIAERVHLSTAILAKELETLGFKVQNKTFFDTLTIETGDQTQIIANAAVAQNINLRLIDDKHLGLSLDETIEEQDLVALLKIFKKGSGLDISDSSTSPFLTPSSPLEAFLREDAPLSHPVFNRYHTETEMMRYLRKLADKDIALDRSMIPLGSCTMKLNAASEMIPVTWEAFANMHPFAPLDQAQGYMEMIDGLEKMLCTITGYDAISLQPNAGSQGEYAGLLAIQAYHQSQGDHHRTVCLIPSSAHGTNPASAQMCNMKVVVVACDHDGNVDVNDLRAKAELHSNNLAAIMVTYPSTHGVFEERIKEVCSIVHEHGGQVYMDGANLNAMVGLCYPGQFGGDVSHLNLHKTFCIPHGGGGPGVGPIGVGAHLAPFMPGHKAVDTETKPVGAVSAAPWGSAGILPISWMYISMMGARGLVEATEAAILNANYIAEKLRSHYPILYTGSKDRVAHECIIDLRPIKDSSGISVEDVAKRLIDYGFHAPTMSFPVSGTLMIEPTESESKMELDRFCDAMIQIRKEIEAVEWDKLPLDDNPLVNAPHTAAVVTADKWEHAYTREQAAYPLDSLRENKYWSPVGRVDNVYGDRNLICSCPSISEYEE